MLTRRTWSELPQTQLRKAQMRPDYIETGELPQTQLRNDETPANEFLGCELPQTQLRKGTIRTRYQATTWL